MAFFIIIEYIDTTDVEQTAEYFLLIAIVKKQIFAKKRVPNKNTKKSIEVATPDFSRTNKTQRLRGPCVHNDG